MSATVRRIAMECIRMTSVYSLFLKLALNVSAVLKLSGKKNHLLDGHALLRSVVTNQLQRLLLLLFQVQVRNHTIHSILISSFKYFVSCLDFVTVHSCDDKFASTHLFCLFGIIVSIKYQLLGYSLH